MILRVFTGRFVQTAERMSLVAIGLAVMVLANALLVVALVNKAHTVVMVPPALADTAEITQGRANDATLSAWGLSVANLVGNATPSNMPLILETLRSLMTPSAYQTISDQLTRQARDLQNDQLTLSFSARDLRVDSDTGRVFVTGMGPALAEHGDGARFREALRLEAAPLVLFVGQKYAYKGLAVLLEAARLVWQRRPETRFVFLGPRTPYSRRLFAAVTDERVSELDMVAVQTKTDAYAACDVVCLPSTQESFGGVYTEAWSLGKPVIGADVPAVRDVISDAVDGYVVAPRADAIAEHILHLIDSPALRAELGEAGRRKVAARYTWPRLAARTLEVYREVLGGRVAAETVAVRAAPVEPGVPERCA